MCSGADLNRRPSAHKTDALTNWATRAGCSDTGTRTPAKRVKTFDPNQLDYIGRFEMCEAFSASHFCMRVSWFASLIAFWLLYDT